MIDAISGGLRTAIIATAVAAAAAGCGSSGTKKASTSSAASDTAKGHAVRQRLPKPGARVPASLNEFVGRDSTGRYGIAIAADTKSGGIVAYICDSRKVGRWFEGSFAGAKLALTGKNGAQLNGTTSTRRITGSATFQGQTVKFSLRPAHKGSGLRRLAPTTRGKPIEIGWVVDNNGRIDGGGNGPNGQFLSATVNTTEGAPSPGNNQGGVGQSTNGGSGGGGGGGTVDPQLFRRLRCASTVLEISRQNNAKLEGSTSFNAGTLAAANKRFDDLKCSDFFTRPG